MSDSDDGGDLDASAAFWRKIRATLAVRPVDDVPRSLKQHKLRQYQKLGATVSLGSLKESLSTAFDNAAEAVGERMAGDDLDLVGDERDSRLELAAFDTRLSERDVDGFGREHQPDKLVADGLGWSDEAPALARDLTADARLERPRRPELTTKPFLLGYFKSLRLVDQGITRVDRGLVGLRNLKSLSLSSNQIGILSVGCLPRQLEVLQIFNAGIHTVRTRSPRRLPGRREIDAEVQLPSLLHLGVGFNLIDEEALSSIAEAFPSLTSLDLCHNGLSDTRRVLTCLRDRLPQIEHLLLMGNPMCMDLGYRSRCIATLPDVTRFDDLALDEDDLRAARTAMQKLGLTIYGEGKEEAAAASDSNGKEGAAPTTPEGDDEGTTNAVGGGMLAQKRPEEGNIVMRVRVGKLQQLPGPVLTRGEPDAEAVAAAEEAGEEPPLGPLSVSYKSVREGEEADAEGEAMTAAAEEIDLRFFVRLLPPGTGALPQTTAAKRWSYPGLAFNEDVMLTVPLVSDLAVGVQFQGLVVQVWRSLPGKKKLAAPPNEGDGDGEEGSAVTENAEAAAVVAVAAAREEGEKGEGSMDDASAEAAGAVDDPASYSLPAREDELVAQATVPLSSFLDSMNDGQREISVDAVTCVGPLWHLPDPLALRDLEERLARAAVPAPATADGKSNMAERKDGKEENEGKDAAGKGADQGGGAADEDVTGLRMPTLSCSVALNPTAPPAPAEEEEEEPQGKSRPNSKKSKKKKKK